MSRSGYTEDYNESFPNAFELYRANVERAFDGKRGQKFLNDLISALDAMPEKKLISGALMVNPADTMGPTRFSWPDRLPKEAGVCAIGALGVQRGLQMEGIDPDDAESVGRLFGIAECMAREVVFENDEGSYAPETSEQRWHRVRAWAASHLSPPQPYAQPFRVG